MELLKKYERHLSGVAFTVGFVLDYIFAPEIDNPFTPLILGGYLLLAAVTILAEQVFWRVKIQHSSWLRWGSVIPTLTQLVFGALMSMLFVYYSRSAALEGSWPFMLLLGGMFIGNELFRDRVRLFKFQLATFFFVFFMAMVLCVPIALREVGTIPFLIAGALALLGTLFFIGSIFALSRKIVRENALGILGMVGGMYALINVLYFTHVIPPIPLLLRDSGVYHSVVRDAAGNYIGSGEKTLWGERFGVLGLQQKVLHLTAGEPAYFYSAVFAPIAIRTPIVHEWQYKDAATGEWNTVHRVSFPIIGGRDGGYRGYSIKESVPQGEWRVSIETASGELLGRETFRVVLSENSAFL